MYNIHIIDLFDVEIRISWTWTNEKRQQQPATMNEKINVKCTLQFQTAKVFLFLHVSSSSFNPSKANRRKLTIVFNSHALTCSTTRSCFHLQIHEWGVESHIYVRRKKEKNCCEFVHWLWHWSVFCGARSREKNINKIYVANNKLTNLPSPSHRTSVWYERECVSKRVRNSQATATECGKSDFCVFLYLVGRQQEKNKNDEEEK